MSRTTDPQPVTVYRGRRDGHAYEVHAQHPFLEARAEIVIDGVRHDPKAEKEPQAADGLAFRIEEGFARTVYQVRRPDGDGTLADAERIVVRTALRGAGEVDVTDALGLRAQPMRPEPGSASAAREERKAAHPLRYALLAAAGKGAGYLLPLLGIGALLSGVLEPVREALRWLRETLLGWIPPLPRIPWPRIPWPRIDLDLPDLPSLPLPDLPDLPDLPGWVIPVLVVVGAGVLTWAESRRRARRLAAAEQEHGEAERSEDGWSSPPR